MFYKKKENRVFYTYFAHIEELLQNLKNKTSS